VIEIEWKKNAPRLSLEIASKSAGVAKRFGFPALNCEMISL
jgi:hypothetical protein